MLPKQYSDCPNESSEPSTESANVSAAQVGDGNIESEFENHETMPDAVAPVKFDDLEMAFEFVNSGGPMENLAFISPDTGAIHYRSDWDDTDVDPEGVEIDDRFIAIPHKNDLDLGHDLVFRFADLALPEKYGEIDRFFRKKGAYARFKDLLAEEGLLEQWYAFEAEAQKRALRHWCEENGIPIPDGDATLPKR